jgi:uridine monophosphate synthetase
MGLFSVNLVIIFFIMNPKEQAIADIAQTCINFGHFTLKSGAESLYYVDLRSLLSCPCAMRNLAIHITNTIGQNIDLSQDYIVCGVPYGGIPIATHVSSIINSPLIMPRKEEKTYGKCKRIEGEFKPGDKIIVIEDVVTTGNSLLETCQILESEGLVVSCIVVVLDRLTNGIQNIQKKGYNVITLFDIKDILNYLYNSFRYPQKSFVKQIINQFSPAQLSAEYYYRTKLSNTQPNTIINQLYQNIINKKSNLVVSVDNTNPSEIWNIMTQIAPYICMVKFHTDTWDIQTIEQFNSLMADIKKLSNEHNFMIMEDKKISDIDKTAVKQLVNGVYSIYKWADMVTIHSFALTPMIKQLGIGLVLVDSMSHFSSLKIMDEQYLEKCHQIISDPSEDNSNVIGFVSQDCVKHNSPHNPRVFMTPGVNLTPSKKNDQQYISLEEAFARKSDLIIVGSDICQSENISAMAELYQKRGWENANL